MANHDLYAICGRPFEAAQYLKSLNPHVEVAVLDLQTNISTPVIWKSETSPVPMKRK
jgi:hypothetical protein